MKNLVEREDRVFRSKLFCLTCGNQDRFIEVMLSEVHLVDGNLNYIKLIEGVTDHYICYICGGAVDSEWT